MNDNIETILKDLYLIDPIFRKHEVQLRKLITELIQARPDTHFDEAFAMRLRAELMQKFPEQVMTHTTRRKIVSPYFSHSFLFNIRVWAPTALLILLLPFSYLGIRNLVTKRTDTGFTLEQQISDKGTQAFGILPVPTVAKHSTVFLVPEVVTPTPTSATEPTQALMPDQTIMSGKANTGPALGPQRMIGAPVSPTVVPQLPPVIGTSQVQSKKGATPSVVSYAYTGTPLVLKDTTGKVYRRINGTTSNTDLAKIIQNSNFGVIDFNKFANLKPQHMQWVDDSTFGYIVDIDFNGGVISINPYAASWPHIVANESMFTLPADKVLTNISDAFLKDHGINTSLYKAPVVVRDVDSIKNGKVIVGETVTIIYPITIDGLSVYDESGHPDGLTVLINLKSRRVESINNLTSQKYESATYDLVTDGNKVIAEATGGTTTSPGTSTINLQTPERILLKTWVSESGAQTGELYVPALLFKTQTDTSTSGVSIIVPLTKEMFTQKK